MFIVSNSMGISIEIFYLTFLQLTQAMVDPQTQCHSVLTPVSKPGRSTSEPSGQSGLTLVGTVGLNWGQVLRWRCGCWAGATLGGPLGSEGRSSTTWFSPGPQGAGMESEWQQKNGKRKTCGPHPWNFMSLYYMW